MKRILPLLTAAASALFVACEPMDVVDPFGIVHDDDESSSSNGQSKSIAGVWHGRSATTQVSTTLNLADADGSIFGSLSWPHGDNRSISGSRTGSSVTLHIGGGDTWQLTCSGNSMSGTGYKAGGGTYALSFSK